MNRPIVFEHVRDNGETLQTSVLIVPLDEWRHRPESLSTMWQPYAKGDVVMAVAIDVVGPPIIDDAAFNPVFKLPKPKAERRPKSKKRKS